MSVPWIVAQLGGDVINNRADDPVGFLSQRMILFLDYIFAEREPGNYKWSKEVAETEIVITAEIPLKLEAPDFAPAIQLIMGTVSPMNLSMNNLLHWDLLTGKTTHMDMWQGQAVFNVFSSNDEEAKRIGAIISMSMQRRRQRFIRMAQLHMVGLTLQQSPVSPPNQLATVNPPEADAYMVSVAFPFFFRETWERLPKQVPHGQHSEEFGVDGARPGIDYEELPTVNQVDIMTRMYRPGQFEQHREDIMSVLSNPENVVTSSGRVLRIADATEAAREEQARRSPYVTSSALIKK